MPVPEHLAPHLRASHRKALFAAARIACVAALVSCAPKAPAPDVVPAATDPAPDPGAPTAEAVAECTAHVEQVFGAQAPPDEVGEETLACCQTLAEHQDTLGPTAETFAHRDDCCEALEWRGSLACTPWGPPTPPPMPGHA